MVIEGMETSILMRAIQNFSLMMFSKVSSFESHGPMGGGPSFRAHHQSSVTAVCIRVGNITGVKDLRQI